MVKFSVSGQAFTPVPTAFLKDYMCDAPQDYVIVYLYGLYLAYDGGRVDNVEMEEVLHMSSAQIDAALNYWVQQGLVRRTGAGDDTSYNFLQDLTQESPAMAPPAPNTLPVYQHRNYNKKLEKMLKRRLNPADLEKIHDYTDVFGLPHDVVLVMIEHIVELKGHNVSVVYLDKVAETWANDGVNTVQNAKERIEGHQAATGGASTLLRKMGIYGKSPDQTQLSLYKKWTEDWGFTLESIQFAMKDVEFTSGSPFKYLDAILRNLHEQGINTSSGIDQHDQQYETEQNLIKEVLKTMDYSRIAVRPSHERFYNDWVEAGYLHEVILLASKQAMENNAPRRLDSVDALLKEWDKQGLHSLDDVKKYTKQQDQLLKQIQQVYDCAGIKKQIGDGDRTWYITHRDEHGMSHDVLMYAAEISSLANEPIAFMRKVISTWAKDGITTLDKAREQNLNHISKDLKKGADFEQHSYSEEDRNRRRQAAMKMVENPNE